MLSGAQNCPVESGACASRPPQLQSVSQGKKAQTASDSICGCDDRIPLKMALQW